MHKLIGSKYVYNKYMQRLIKYQDKLDKKTNAKFIDLKEKLAISEEKNRILQINVQRLCDPIGTLESFGKITADVNALTISNSDADVVPDIDELESNNIPELPVQLYNSCDIEIISRIDIIMRIEKLYSDFEIIKNNSTIVDTNPESESESELESESDSELESDSE
jgi:hypothetical protein